MRPAQSLVERDIERQDRDRVTVYDFFVESRQGIYHERAQRTQRIEENTFEINLTLPVHNAFSMRSLCSFVVNSLFAE